MHVSEDTSTTTRRRSRRIERFREDRETPLIATTRTRSRETTTLNFTLDVYFHVDYLLHSPEMDNKRRGATATQLRRNSIAGGTGREVVAGQRNVWRHVTSPNFTPRRIFSAIFERFHWYSRYPFHTLLLLEMLRMSRCSWGGRNMRENNDISTTRYLKELVSPSPPFTLSFFPMNPRFFDVFSRYSRITIDTRILFEMLEDTRSSE